MSGLWKKLHGVRIYPNTISMPWQAGSTSCCPLISRFSNACTEIIYAAYPPKEFDKSSWNCLFHKNDKGKLLTILFPDECNEQPYKRDEALDFADKAGKDLVERQVFNCLLI
jgi:hypothetical protein